MSARIHLVLGIEDPRWKTALPDIQAILERSIGTAFGEAAVGDRPVEVEVQLVDDGTIRDLNRNWRGRDKPTNVLSFPLGAPDPVPDIALPWLAGDIVMSFDTVLAEAERDAKSLGHHVAHLAVHATLHLLGHDHEIDAEATAMEAAEVQLLARLDIPDPYRAADMPAECER